MSTLDEVISIEFDESPLSELVAVVEVEVKFKFPAPSSASITKLKIIISFLRTHKKELSGVEVAVFYLST